MRPERFCGRALDLASALERWHAVHGLHGALTPEFIQENKEGDRVTILPPQRLEDRSDIKTMRYMSPETIGRLPNVDKRSDLYSLGLIFYEWLVGSTPFVSDEILDLAHKQMAVQPQPPFNAAFGVPVVISDIIMKLLAKAPDARYASARGVAYDLRTCQRQLQNYGRIDPLEPGEHDRNSQFRIPDKLYGREQELQILEEFYRRAVAGEIVLCTVAGYSGIGKSALVRALRPKIAASGGNLVEGKFDQYRSETPYSAIVEAFRGLLRQVLGRDQQSVEAWRRSVMQALGENASLVLELLPEMERLIGPQPPPPEISASVGRQRFLIVFSNLLRCFASEEHPLVLFLDDIQWIDAASLDLVEAFVDAGRSAHLLIIAAYRDNEVGATHPVTRLLERFRQRKSLIAEFELGPLHVEHVRELIMGACPNLKQADELTAIVMRRAAGNPFFTRQFLKSLVDQNELYFSEEFNGWRLNLEPSLLSRQDEDIIALIMRRLARMPDQSRAVMRIGAAIGKKFELSILAAVAGCDQAEALIRLAPALQDELLIPLEMSDGKREFQFVHDRVQQASYQLQEGLPDVDLHMAIGWRLLEQTAPENLEVQLFAIVDHLNVASAKIHDPAKRLLVADLNLRANMRAKAALAYQAAAAYVACGKEFLPTDAWERHYALTLDMHLHGAESFSVLNRELAFEREIAVLLLRVSSTSDRIKVRIRQVIHLCQTSRFAEALAIARVGFLELGVDIPPLDDRPALRSLFDRTIEDLRKHLGGKTIAAAIPTLADGHDDIHESAMRLIGALGDAATILNVDLLDCVGVIGAKLSFDTGSTKLSPLMFTLLAQALTGPRQAYPEATAIAAAALALNEQRYMEAWSTGRLLVHQFWFVRHWSSHLIHSLPLIEEAFATTRKAHDPIYGAYLLSMAALTHFFGGRQFSAVIEAHSRVVEHCRPYQMESVVAFSEPYAAAARALRGETSALGDLSDNSFDQADFVSKFSSLPMVMGLLRGAQIPLLTLAGEYSRAVEMSRDANLLKSPPFVAHVRVKFWAGIAYARLAYEMRSSPDERAKFIAGLQDCQNFLQAVHDHGDIESTAHLVFFLRAERAHAERKDVTARSLCRQAMQFAGVSGFTFEEGFIAETLAAWLTEDNVGSVESQFELEHALDCYRACGATALVRRVETALNALQKTPGERRAGHDYELIDEVELAAIMRAAQILGRPVGRNAKAKSLLTNIVELSGADNGAVIRDTGAKLGVELETVQTTLNIGLPEPLLRYVINSLQSVKLGWSSDVLDDPLAREFREHAYFAHVKTASILCIPIGKSDPCRRVLYLEHRQLPNAFIDKRRKVIDWLAAQLAHLLENAELLTNLEGLVEERTSVLHQANVQLEKQRSELEEANKRISAAIDSRDFVLWMVSHELRTPIHAISAIAQRTAMSETDAPLARDMGKILQLVEMSTKLMADLLDTSKIDAGLIQLDDIEFNLDDVLDEIALTHAPAAASKRLEFAFDVEPSLPRVWRGDPLRLKQILSNFIVNAVKYTDEGGVFVTISGVFPPDATAGKVLLEVRDTGPGMSERHIEEIFGGPMRIQPQVRRGKGSYGLGLQISRRLAELIGAEIGVQSTPGDGSTFWLSATFTQVRSPPPAPRADIGGLSALLVTQSEHLARALGRLLSHYDVNVVDVRSRQAALALARSPLESGRSFELMIIDGELPAADPAEISHAIHDVFPNSKHLLLYSIDAAAPSIKGGSFAAAIGKPVVLTKFLESLDLAMLRKTEDEPGAPRPDDVPRANALSGKRVLLVDDNAYVREAWVELLQRFGLAMKGAGDGYEALRLVAEFSFDAVLVDINMPGMDGRELVRRLREKFPRSSMAIVGVTGSDVESLNDKSLGFDEICSKPIEVGALLAILDRLLNH